MTFNPSQPRGADGRWIKTLVGLMKSAGGFTHVVGSGVTNPPKGFSVAVATPDGKDWLTLPQGSTSVADVAKFMLRFREELAKPNRGIGGWSNSDPGEGDVRDALDIIEIFDDLEAAAKAAHAGGQDAIFDLETFETISTKDALRRARRKKELVDMSTLLTPTTHGEYDFAKHDGKIAFWKQILPKKTIHYTAKDGSRRQIDFNEEYLTDLANNKAVDKIGFLLADKDNAHTMDPEKWRGEVAAMEVREDGLYGKIVFPNAEAAKAVLDNPDLGVSARIREGIGRSDGSTVNRGIIHVLGTLDPQVSGMSPWQHTDLSAEGETLDLSNEEYTDMAEKKSIKDYTEADIDAMTEAELDAFLAEFVPEFAPYTGDQTDEVDETDETDDDEDEVETDAVETDETDKTLVGAGADMSNAEADIELANKAVAQANARAEEAMRRVAEAEWKSERDLLLSAGVPAFAIDLAAPVLNRPDDMVIDLSNHDEDDVNVSEVVRNLLGALKGTVDLSSEIGHTGTFTEGEDPDQPLLDAWIAQS